MSILLYGDSIDENTIADDAINPFIVPLSYVYLHGKLQDINGYDLILIDADDIPKLINKDTDHNINDVSVILSDGSVHEATAYIWKVPFGELTFLTRGLVVAKDDEEYNKDAKAKYERRSLII